MIDSNCTIQQTDYCWHRLPCGRCAILNIPCQTQGNQIRVDEPTWKLPEITCKTKDGGSDADILIRGMEMPREDDLLCLNIHPNGDVTINLDLKCIPIARAVELPPHGDLIDRDPIVAHYRECERNLGSERHLEFLTVHDWIEEGIVYDLLNAPVVVPAERSGDDA